MEQIPYIVPMQRSRTTVEGTKPQCQPIDLRCSLRGPLLRREKNKLIERRGRGAEEEKWRWKRTKRWRKDGRETGGSAEREKKRIEKKKGLEERALLKEENAKERNERGTKERADQRAAWWEMQSRMRLLCAQRKGRFLTEITLVRHVRSTNRNFYYYCSLIYFRTPEQAAVGFRLNYREPRNKALPLSFSLSLSLSLFLFLSRFRPLKTIAGRFTYTKYTKIRSVCYSLERARHEIFF